MIITQEYLEQLPDGTDVQMDKFAAMIRALEENTQSEFMGRALVGWALYTGDCQKPLLALNSSEAIKWIMNIPNRSIVPVYSDSWIYGTDE